MLSACTSISPTNNGKPKVLPIAAYKAAHINILQANALNVQRFGNKSEIKQQFGQTKEIDFDSGYSIWIYQFPETPNSPVITIPTDKNSPIIMRELIVLFNADGKLIKTRTNLNQAQ